MVTMLRCIINKIKELNNVNRIDIIYA